MDLSFCDKNVNADLHVGLCFGSLNLGGIVNYKTKKEKKEGTH